MAPPIFRSQRRSLATPGRPAGPVHAPRSGYSGQNARTGDTHVWWRRSPRRSVVLAATLVAGTALLLGLLLMQHMAVAAPTTGRPAASVAPTTLSGGKTFALLPWGSGEGEVGRSSPEQGLDRGPEALAVAQDGRVAVLDSVNHRVAVLTADGVPCGSFAVPLVNPRYLAVSNERVAILDPDDSRRVIVTTWAGEVLDEADAPAGDQPATGVFLEGERVWMETGHSDCLLLCGGDSAQQIGEAHRGRPVSVGASAGWITATLEASGQTLVEISGANGDTSAASAAQAGAALGTAPAAQLRTEAKLGMPVEHLVAVEADHQGRVHMGVRVAGDKQDPCLGVARFAPEVLHGYRAQDAPDAGGQDGRGRAVPTALLLFAEASGPYLGAPFVVAPDGRVLQPVGEANGYRILVHRFTEEG